MPLHLCTLPTCLNPFDVYRTVLFAIIIPNVCLHRIIYCPHIITATTPNCIVLTLIELVEFLAKTVIHFHFFYPIRTSKAQGNNLS
jgi:hypothetical protein